MSLSKKGMLLRRTSTDLIDGQLFLYRIKNSYIIIISNEISKKKFSESACIFFLRSISMHLCCLHLRVSQILIEFSFFHYRVIIENCVLCDKAIVRTGSNLKNCLIGSNHDVAENSFKDKAHLTNADGYMEIE